jgi:hypothetical protein
MEQLRRPTRFGASAQLILPDDGSELVIVLDQFEELYPGETKVVSNSLPARGSDGPAPGRIVVMLGGLL